MRLKSLAASVTASIMIASFPLAGCFVGAEEGDAGNADGGAGPDASVDAGFKPYMPPAPKTPYTDKSYLQEYNHTSNEVEAGIGPLVSVLIPPKTFSGFDLPTQVTPRGIVRHKTGGGFDLLAIAPGGADLLGAAATSDAIFLAAPDSAYTVDKDGVVKGFPVPADTIIQGITGGLTNAYLFTSKGIAVADKGGVHWPNLYKVHTAAVEAQGLLYAGSDSSITVYDIPDGQSLGAQKWSWGDSTTLPVGQIRAMVRNIACSKVVGLAVVGDNGVRGFNLDEFTGQLTAVDVPEFAAGRIPLGSPHAAARGWDGSLIVATAGGAYRSMNRGFGIEWRVYNGERWLPNEDVRAVATDQAVPDGPIWFATPAGLATVTAKGITLEEKLVPFVDRIVNRHDRDGAVADSHLTKKGDLASNIPWDSDNDGSWTSYWLLSECFRYKVSGAADAKVHFDRSLEAMLRLQDLTGTDYFLARSVIRKEGCKLDDCDNPDDGFWYTSPDGKWWVKRDTSNDEVIAHIFMMGHAYDLCADEQQKVRIRRHMSRIIGGIMDHGWQLIDPVTNQVTTYGQYEPAYVNDSIPGMFGDGGDRAAMILAGLTLTHYMTGEQRFLEGKNTLIKKYKYDVAAEGIMDHPMRPGKMDNDEMATYSYFVLLRYEPDPKLREKWMSGWLKLYNGAMKQQQGAWWNMVHAVVGGEDPDIVTAGRWLQLAPVDMIRWDMHNSQRLDLVPSPNPYKDGSMRSDGFIIPYDERRTDRWNTHQYMVDGGMGGMTEMDAADVLAPYWMGRYYGFIVK